MDVQQRVHCNFHSCTVHLDIIKVLKPTDAQKNML